MGCDMKMKCPNCDSENNDGAKFCKKCGTPLNNEVSHEKMINSMSKESSSNSTKYIIIALVIVAVVLAGTFAYLYGFGSNQQNQAVDNNNQNVDAESDESLQAQPAQSNEQSSSSSSSMEILGGTFETGGGLEDKTYATIDVGSQNAGKSVVVQIKYSRDGNALNNGNMVPKTVESSGYIHVKSADSYKYFPDHATINLYDSSGNLLDTKSVSLSPQTGTQSF